MYESWITCNNPRRVTGQIQSVCCLSEDKHCQGKGHKEFIRAWQTGEGTGTGIRSMVGFDERVKVGLRKLIKIHNDLLSLRCSLREGETVMWWANWNSLFGFLSYPKLSIAAKGMLD